MFGVCRSSSTDVPSHAPPPAPGGAAASASKGEGLKAAQGYSVRERMVAAQRNLQLTGKVLPIALRFRDAQRRMRSVHRKLRKSDPDAYYKKRNAVWDEIHEREAAGIAAIGRDMGGIYNKGWQFMATQDLMMPGPWVDAMQFSFEEFPPRPWPSMEAILEASMRTKPPVKPLARGLARWFARIDQRPLASASIGQVHCAELYDGSRVVVKILYPEIRTHMRSDLKNIEAVSDLVFSMTDMPMKDTMKVVLAEFAVSFPREMDFTHELDNTRRTRDQLERSGVTDCAIPRVYPALSSTEVLVQERLEGRTIASLGDGGGDPAAARRALGVLVDVLGRMIFEDGYFHADTHPGNVMMMDDGRVGLIDFGQCCRVTDRERKLLCMTVLLLRCRSPALLKLVFCDLPSSTEEFKFAFNTDDAAEIGALFQYFFDTDVTGDGSVSRETFAHLRATARYKPTALPVATGAPPWIVFYGRVVASLRKCFEKVGVEGFSTVAAWYPVARRSLAAQRARETEPDDAADWLLTLLPEDPAAIDAGRDALSALLAAPGPRRVEDAARLRGLFRRSPVAPAAALEALALVDARPKLSRGLFFAAALWCLYGALRVALLPLRLLGTLSRSPWSRRWTARCGGRASAGAARIARGRRGART